MGWKRRPEKRSKKKKLFLSFSHFFIAAAICCSACELSSANRTPVLALCFIYFSQHLVTHCFFGGVRVFLGVET